ncbi:hypothetical protein BO70DRAFT_413865 [Aspergillus heteromorphus CBS 117.55]|uniref:F-box domain-containing protein n=1 Tax=Aspergillus heteromorphus CBS 117.55 TaxID=1448321 RepID=A0A317VK38_9EURO|nr:uncharacterized protein BO70DRAFT_413865 [Aspergillus heteromorphus CBS 117.55]PWY72270.1 hypothetical protein BO70DRAFT_413865 [Aspergillus heteromorphus CBS 117.55]
MAQLIQWFCTRSVSLVHREKAPLSNFPFLRLPREIRDQIYRELLTRPDHDEIFIRWSDESKRWSDVTKQCYCRRKREYNGCTRPLDTAILYTCKVVHEEALLALYENSKIWIDAPPAKALEFLSSHSFVGVRGIRHLKLTMSTFADRTKRSSEETWLWSLVKKYIDSERQDPELYLIDPWLDLFAFIRKNLQHLHTLHICRRRELPLYFLPRDDEFARMHNFCKRDWMDQVRITPQISTLLVDVDCLSYDHVFPFEVDSLHGLRKELSHVSGFKEVAADWELYAVVSEDDCSKGRPYSRFWLSLTRRDPSQSRNDEDALTPLPLFEKSFTMDDSFGFKIWNWRDPNLDSQ